MPVFEILQNEPDARDYAPGQEIFREGAPGDCMYAVLQGAVQVRKGERLLETVEHGGVFGEMALIDRTTRSATAVAQTACRVVAISERRFLVLVQQTPFFAILMMQVLTERLRRNTES